MSLCVKAKRKLFPSVSSPTSPHMFYTRNIFACYSDPLSNYGYLRQLLWFFGLTVLPSIFLVINSIAELNSNVRKLQSLSTYLSIYEPLDNSRVAIVALQNELTQVAQLIKRSSAPNTFSSLNEIFEKTNMSLGSRNEFLLNPNNLQYKASKNDLIYELNKRRLSNIDLTNSEPISVIDSYYVMIFEMDEATTNYLFIKTKDHVFSFSTVANSLFNIMTHCGLLQVLGMLYYFNGQLDDLEWLMFIESKEIVNQELPNVLPLDFLVKSFWLDKQASLSTFWKSLEDMEEEISANNPLDEINPPKGLNWVAKNQYKIHVIDLLLELIRRETVVYSEYNLIISKSLIAFHAIIIIIIIFITLPLSYFSSLYTANSLRSYVRMTEQKSLEIRKEKRKTEKLLHEMLPKSMAYRLQKGEQILAEQFQRVTLFFSDIADFTEISINSAPIEIVRFLNDVYNFIDSQIVRYDVYKVETIGCVYMVSSGIPSRNGDRHCVEISRLSIDLIEACDEFVIPHMQDHKLQLRIGVHTGPVVGGIVGNKMPRYCLFGDTVNTASRMQSNGLPHHIHISDATNRALQKTGGFETKLRGEIDVKGKGTMVTYWLVGREAPKTPTSMIIPDA